MWEARDVCGGGAGGRNPNEQKRRNKTLARGGAGNGDAEA